MSPLTWSKSNQSTIPTWTNKKMKTPWITEENQITMIDLDMLSLRTSFFIESKKKMILSEVDRRSNEKEKRKKMYKIVMTELVNNDQKRLGELIRKIEMINLEFMMLE